jgi:hypothetical protein
MFNPFYAFNEAFLQGAVSQGKQFFVRQSFPRGKSAVDKDVKGAYLITHYDHYAAAKGHFDAISHDPYCFLYDWNNPEHNSRLKKATSPGKEYRIYAAVMKVDWEKDIPFWTKEKVKRYAARYGWGSTGRKKMHGIFELHVGELFLRLQSGGMNRAIKFEEIENLR